MLLVFSEQPAAASRQATCLRIAASSIPAGVRQVRLRSESTLAEAQRQQSKLAPHQRNQSSDGLRSAVETPRRRDITTAARP